MLLEEQSIKAEDFTVVGMATWGYRLIALNWALHMKRLDIENYIIYCLDDSIYEFFKDRNIKCRMLQVPESKATEALVGTKNVFKTFIQSVDKASIFDVKMRLFTKAMMTHKNFVYSDLDAVWLKDIFPLLIKHLKDYDVVLTGNPYSIFWSPSVLCAFKASEAAQGFIKGWHDEYFRSEEPNVPRTIFHDIACANFIHKNSNKPEDDGDRYFSYTVGTAKVKVLRKEVIVYPSIDKKTSREMYVYHAWRKENLLQPDFWSVPWFTTFQGITFIGILYFLWRRVPFFGAHSGRFAPHRIILRLLKMFGKGT